MAGTIKYGKAAESIVLGALLQEDIDVYPALADDKGIDAVIRSKGGKYYWDLQIKSSFDWGTILAKTKMAKRKNYILILFHSELWEMIWLSSQIMKELFPATDDDWGDVYLNKKLVEELKAKGHMNLNKLRKFINKGVDAL